MNSFKDIRHPSIIITLILSITLAVLIIHRVSRVTSFSKRVTDFYAPTTHSVKDFETAVGHVVMGIKNNGFPEQVALHHFKTATKTLIDLTGTWEPAYRKHIEGMLKKAEDISLKMNNGIITDKNLLPELKQLHQEAVHHVAMHDAELKNARSGIKDSALLIRIVALSLLAAGVILSYREVRQQRLKEREQEKLSAIKAFASALDARDPYTKGHSVRVADYAVCTGKEMRLKRETLDHIYTAALMHDIGKIAVSDAVLRKEGKLNDAEWHEMKMHPISTANVLKDFDSLKEIIPWALYHHERFDGKGYPEGKSGTNIPLPAQIIAIADAFDAMTSARPYRPAMPMEKALSEIEKNRGIQWHPDVVDAFMRCIKNGNISLKEENDERI